MARNIIATKKDYCVGCRNCELMCSYSHTGSFNPSRSRIRISSDAALGLDKPIVCRQCRNTPCKEACPNEAFKLNDAGVYAIDDQLCNGCGLCIEACPFEAIFMDPIAGKALKCDLCNGDPQCVKVCRKLPYNEYKAISYKEPVLPSC